MSDFENHWPPQFSLDQERVLNLLTGDRFYSNASAALREAVLNAIDATHRRRSHDPDLISVISLVFDSGNLTLSVTDNGDGMDRSAMLELFTRVGASASKLNGSGSVGEFGIGVISYFMACDSFTVQTCDGISEPIGLEFSREMLAGGAAKPIPITHTMRGTSVKMCLRDLKTFKLLKSSFNHWCRDVEGLTAVSLPENEVLHQGEVFRPSTIDILNKPSWVERAHLAPISEPQGWESMSGTSTISVLYRGVFVQQHAAHRLWGIEGSIDVDPKHFKPRLNREGFVQGPFEAEVNELLTQIHPSILVAMATRLSNAFDQGQLDKWVARRWATLWLSVPRGPAYAAAAAAWDVVYRRIPAFEIATGNKWEEISLEQLLKLDRPFYVAPLRDDNRKELVAAALRLLRHTKRTVIRGFQPEKQWLRDAKYSFNTTADLIANAFASELSPLLSLESQAEAILQQVTPLATLFAGKPVVELVRLGSESPPLLRLSGRLIINIDNSTGKAIVDEAVTANLGRWSLIAIVARLSHQHTSEVAASVRDSKVNLERLGLVKRRYIKGLLT